MPIDPDKLLAVIAGQVNDVDRRVREIEDASLVERIDGLTKTLNAVLHVVEALQPADPDEPMPVGYVPNWAILDREQAADVWAGLVDWCRTVLHPMYVRQHWRPCWYADGHARLRLELTWLWAYWRWAYEPQAPPSRAAEWHARWLPHIIGVIDEQLAQCGPKSKNLLAPKHDIPPGHHERDFADDEALGQWILEDCARRPEPKERRAENA